MPEEAAVKEEAVKEFAPEVSEIVDKIENVYLDPTDYSPVR